MQHIEQLAQTYADANDQLMTLGRDLEREIGDTYREHIDLLRLAVREANDAHDALYNAIEAEPELFVKPRTRTLHGVKFGLQKQKGKVVIEDNAKVVERIRKLLPEDQQELMIRVTEAVHKPAVNDLSAADLKRLGITVTADSDTVTIKIVDSVADKFIQALRADVAKQEAE